MVGTHLRSCALQGFSAGNVEVSGYNTQYQRGGQFLVVYINLIEKVYYCKLNKKHENSTVQKQKDLAKMILWSAMFAPVALFFLMYISAFLAKVTINGRAITQAVCHHQLPTTAAWV